MWILTFNLLGCGNQKAPDPQMLMAQRCSEKQMATLSKDEEREKAAKACWSLGSDQLNAPVPDYAKARKHFGNGCAVQHAESCNALGTLVRDARGGPPDMVRAGRLFETACEKGSAIACVNFADLLREGEGIDQDLEKAVGLYQARCDAQPPLPKACASLSEMLRAGDGVEKKDEETADALLEKACDASFPPACQALGDVFAESRKKEDIEKAAELYDKACGIDANHGCFELARMHIDKKVEDASYEQAGEYFSMICRVDASRGCYELAELMTDEHVPSREGEKEALYKLACESGNSEACEKR